MLNPAIKTSTKLYTMPNLHPIRQHLILFPPLIPGLLPGVLIAVFFLTACEEAPLGLEQPQPSATRATQPDVDSATKFSITKTSSTTPLRLLSRLTPHQLETLRAKIEGSPWADAVTIINTGETTSALTSRRLSEPSTPDVLHLPLSFVPELVAAKLISPVPVDNMTRSLPSGVDALISRGSVRFAFAERLTCHVLFFNRGMLESIQEPPPQDWGTLVRVARLLTNDNAGFHSLHPLFEDGKIDRHGVFIRSDLKSFMPIVWAYGGAGVRSNQVQIGHQPAVRAAQYLQNLRSRHRISPRWPNAPARHKTLADMFTSGRFAMLIGDSDQIPDLIGQGEFKEADNLGVTTLPRGVDGQGGCVPDGMGYVVASSSTQRKRAIALGRWLVHEDLQRHMAQSHHVAVAMLSVRRDKQLRQNRLLDVVWNAAEQGRSREVFAGISRMGDSLEPALVEILNGTTPPKEGLERVAGDWRVLWAEMPPHEVK